MLGKLIRMGITLALVLVLLLVFAVLARAEGRLSPPVIDKSRVITFAGAVDGETARDAMVELYRKHTESPGTPIDLVIHSPGGQVIAGYFLLSTMDEIRALGTPIRCYVPTIAASMAFQMLVHCSERYTLDKAFLLWHAVRVNLSGEVLTAAQIRDILEGLDAIDRRMLEELMASPLGKDLGMKELMRHSLAETLHQGKDLAAMAPSFITSYPTIPGLMEILLAELAKPAIRQW